MYQARSLIGSDASGLSDPYAQIIFGEHTIKTQVWYYSVILLNSNYIHLTLKLFINS